MSHRILCLTLCTLSALLFAHNAAADELLLRDGSRILGTVKKKEGNTLEFKTSFAGTIQVNWDQVSELRTDRPAQVLLNNDKVVSARLFKNRTDSTILQSGPDTPPESFGPAEVAFINPEPWRLGESFKFSGRVNFALESQRGNTDEDEIDIDGHLSWRRKHDRFTLRGELEHDKNDGRTTADNWELSGKYDHFVTKKWYYGAYLLSEADDFAELTLRVGAGPGVGYQFFESEELNLSTEVGLIRVYEDFQTQENDKYWAAGWMINFDKYVLPALFKSYHLQLYHRNTGLWNLYSTSDVIWNTWTGLRFPLLLGLVASTEVKAEYDSGAAPDADEVDTTYTLKLGYQW
jgi:putative salt-induced outer membrane protein YdiY